MRKFKFLTVILTFMVFLGAFAACNPNTSSSSQDPAPVHTCESVCGTCGKCTDLECTEEACADKCPGHTTTPEHTCESVCETCGKCKDAECTEAACADKCPGHTVDGVHICETACRACGLCKNETCTEEACKNKCVHTGYVDTVCETCGLCADEECNGEECGGKCPGHTGSSKYIDYRKDVFKNKRALFIGDSICEAICEKDEEIRGWGGRIQSSTNMECVNVGLSGASISTSGPSSGADGKATKRILTQYMKEKDKNFDFVIMQGGVNDAWVSAEVGNITGSFDVNDFNIDTYAGALEELFYHVTKDYSNAKLGYIFTFKTPKFTTGRIQDMTEYYNMAKQICEKWNVPFLNMYEDETLSEDLKVNTKENLSDYLHPNTSGYDVLYKYIMYWMEKLPVYSEIEEGDKLETLPADVLPSEPDLGCSGIWSDFC